MFLSYEKSVRIYTISSTNHNKLLDFLDPTPEKNSKAWLLETKLDKPTHTKEKIGWFFY
jgi:hypothetical protein